MITALDTNVLLDVLGPGSAFSAESLSHLDAAAAAGSLIVSEAVYAELAAVFPSQGELDAFLETTGIAPVPSSPAALWHAGVAWRAYGQRRPSALVCPQCGATHEASCNRCGRSLRPRQHVVADFLIGAHAGEHADRLLTRDRGFYRAYFPALRLVGAP